MAVEPIPHPPSGNISSIAYDADAQLLIIRFNSGYTYRYFEVPGDVAAGFSSALNANDYLRTYVVNSFAYERL